METVSERERWADRDKKVDKIVLERARERERGKEKKRWGDRDRQRQRWRAMKRKQRYG